MLAQLTEKLLALRRELLGLGVELLRIPGGEAIDDGPARRSSKAPAAGPGGLRDPRAFPRWRLRTRASACGGRAPARGRFSGRPTLSPAAPRRPDRAGRVARRSAGGTRGCRSRPADG